MAVLVTTREKFREDWERMEREHPDAVVWWVKAVPDGRVAIAVADSEMEAKKEIRDALREDVNRG